MVRHCNWLFHVRYSYLLDVGTGIQLVYLFFHIEHVTHSVTVYTSMNLFEATILMLLCIGEYSVTSYLGNI